MTIQKRLDDAKDIAARKYGRESVNIGDHHYRLNVVRTPSLMLDYMLGIGGFPYGHGVEVYGANQIGKSSALGYGVLANVQREGKLPALIAVEPRLATPEDREWAQKLGLDPDAMLIQYPDNVEMAFAMLRDLVYGNLVDYIMVDSIGGMGTASSANAEGTKKAYGISGDVTDGLNAIMPRLYKNNIGLLLINQQRQKTQQAGRGRMGMIGYDSPGGEALKHHMRIRINLRPGKERYTVKYNGDDVLVGRELTCVFEKNNMAQAAKKRASFNFFHIDTKEYGFGVDTTDDVLRVGKFTGVLEGGTWVSHHTFPKGKLNGKVAVRAYLDENPEAYETIRQEVLAVMIKEEQEAAVQKAEDVAAVHSGEVNHETEVEDGSDE